MDYYRLGDIAHIRFCVISPGRMRLQDEPICCLSCSNFNEDNVIVGKPTDIFYAIDPDLEIHSDDIVIKRITPMYVNYIEKIDNGLFAGNNLILITASKDFYAKYIAAILNEKILTLSEETSVGAVMKSVSRQALEEIKIAWIAYERQVAIGNLWFYNIERKKMMNRLAELEYNRTNYYISHLAENGGKEHG